jgi:sodium/pantothenate symporter
LLVAYMVAQFIAGARILEVVLGIPYLWGVVIFALSVAIYTSYGGFRAVAWTDSFQGIVMVLGIVVMVPLAVRTAGGLHRMTESLMAQSPELLLGPGPNNFLPLAMAVSFFCVWPLSSLGQPHLITRFLVFKDSQALKKAMFLMGPYVFLTYVSICLVALAGRAVIPGLANPDQAMPTIALTVAPPLLAGLVVSAPFAAVMSTVSSMLLTVSAVMVRDIYQKAFNQKTTQRGVRWLSYLSTLIIGLLTLAFSLKPPRFLQYIVIFAGTGLAASLLCPIVFGLYWKRASKAGGISSLLGGFISFILQHVVPGWENVGGFLPFVWSLLLSLVLMISVSLLSPSASSGGYRRYFLGRVASSKPSPLS